MTSLADLAQPSAGYQRPGDPYNTYYPATGPRLGSGGQVLNPNWQAEAAQFIQGMIPTAANTLLPQAQAPQAPTAQARPPANRPSGLPNLPGDHFQMAANPLSGTPFAHLASLLFG